MYIHRPKTQPIIPLDPLLKSSGKACYKQYMWSTWSKYKFIHCSHTADGLSVCSCVWTATHAHVKIKTRCHWMGSTRECDRTITARAIQVWLMKRKPQTKRKVNRNGNRMNETAVARSSDSPSLNKGINRTCVTTPLKRRGKKDLLLYSHRLSLRERFYIKRFYPFKVIP